MKFLIMHGSFGSPDSNWFRWLETELLGLGQEVILEQFPSDNWEALTAAGREKRDQLPLQQNLKSWSRVFEQTVLPQIQGAPFVFIGHSIAPVFFLHMLEKYDLQPTLAVFVSPFLSLEDSRKDWQFFPVNKTFYKTDFHFPKIRKQIERSYVVYGDDDPYVPTEKTLEFAAKLESIAIAVKNGGHLGRAFAKLPIILELITSNLILRK